MKFSFKKALAVTLAAATALTFAPVASLTNGVTANAAAANVNISLTIPGSAYSDNATGVNATASESTMGYTNIHAAKAADGMEIDGLSVVSKSKNAWYKIAAITNGIDSVKDISKTTEADKYDAKSLFKTVVSNPNSATEDQYLVTNAYTYSDNNGKINLGNVYLHNGGVSTIVLVDLGTDGKGTTTDGENITLTINADQNKQNVPAAHVYATSQTGNTAAVLGDEITPQGSVFFLDLNKYKPGYLLSYTNNNTNSIKYTNWAGSDIDVTSIELNAANRSIQWGSSTDGITWTYATDSKKVLSATSTNTYDAATTISNIFTSGKNPNGVVFKTTAATAGTDAIDVTLKGANGGSASTSVKFSTERSTASVDSITSTTGTIGGSDPNFTLTGLDVQINKSGKITVKSESGDYRFISVDPSIITIDEKTGEFKVLKKGNTQIQVYVGSTVNNKPAVKTIDVTVSPWATDSIAVSSDKNVEYYTLDDVNYLDLDVPDSKAPNAVKSATLVAKSAGSLTTKWSIVSGYPTDVVSVDENTGLVTAKKAGSTKIRVSTNNSTEKEIFGSYTDVVVTVWTLPAAIFTVAPVTVNVGESTLITPVVTSPASYTYTVNYDSKHGVGHESKYTLTNPGSAHQNTQTSSRLTGTKIGTDAVLVTVLGTSANRPTTRTASVTVLDKTAVNTITLDDNSKSLILEEGATAQLSGKASIAGKTVTFEGGDANVATVTTAGAVKAVKAGKTTIKAVSDGAESVEIPVIVTAKPVVYADPAQVTGVKVSNKKGAKVTVKFAADTTNETMKYYVQKKVSGKKAGKSIGSTKTTLSVKKGATVKVRVKAYYYDANGVKHVGAYSAWKTLKTDKK